MNSNLSKHFFCLPFTPIKYDEAVKEILELAAKEKASYVVTPNVHHFFLYKTNQFFRNAYKAAHISLLDGMPLVWATSFLYKTKFEKISGSDIFIDLINQSIKKGMKIFLLGGKPGVAEKAVTNLDLDKYINTQISYYSPAFNFSEEENNTIIEKIKSFRPNILFVAFGAPKQELWIQENIKKIHVGVALGIGGSIDFVAGVQRRAPFWMQKNGLEWFYRLCINPKKFFFRYLITNTYFLPFFLCAFIKGMIRGQD